MAEVSAIENTRLWRVGRRVGRTIYMQLGAEPSDDDVLIGVMDSPEIAAEAIKWHNARRRFDMTEQVYENGKPIGSLAELAHTRTVDPLGDDLANFQVQGNIADALRRWLVPPSHRPTCPLDQQPCTSWTCLVDVCVDAKKAED